MKKYLSEKFRFSKSISGRSSGFTLIEILVALVVIGLLSAISIPMYNDYLDRARLTVSINTMETVRKAIDDYYMVNGTYPPDLNMTTGEDGLGRVVLDSSQIADFNKTLYSMESYISASPATYTLTALAADRKHTRLVLTPGQVLSQGP